MGYTDAIRVLCVGGDGDPATAEVTAARSLAPVTATNIVEAVKRIREASVDCIVIGPSIESDTVVPVIQRLREERPETPIIVVGDPSNPDEVIEAVNAGATKYERFTDPKSDLVGLIAHLATDQRVDASLDRHRGLNQAIWAATESAIIAEDQSGIESAVQRELGEAEMIESVWIGQCLDTDTFVSIHRPYDAELSRSQLTALIGDEGTDAIDRAVETREVQAIESINGGTNGTESTGVIVPLVEDEGTHGILILAIAEPNGLDAADRAALQRFGRVIGRLLGLTIDSLDPAERTEAVMGLVSHEVRNPLTTAMSSLQIARESGESSAFDRVERALEEIERTISTLNTLFSREEIQQTVEKTFEETAIRAWEDTATPTANLEIEEVGEIRAHHDLLERLLVNLFRNAIQYSDSPVSVRVGRAGDGFFVEDDGPGISEEDRDAVFDWGYTTRDDGFGLGLALVRDIADVHGWSVRVSASEAGGARFEFTGLELPLVDESDENDSERVRDQ